MNLCCFVDLGSLPLLVLGFFVFVFVSYWVVFFFVNQKILKIRGRIILYVVLGFPISVPWYLKHFFVCF